MAISAGGSGGGVGWSNGAEAAVGKMNEVVAVLGELVDGIQGAVKGISEFVAAIAPSAVQEFARTIKDLQATIGSAFIGVINVASSVVREIAGVLLPVMQRLAPVFTEIANAVGTSFVSVVRLAVAQFELMIPLIKILADLFSEYAKYVSDINALWTALYKTISTFLDSVFGGFSLKDTFKGFFDVLRQVVRALITFAATLAVAAGAAGLVTRFGDALAKEARDRDERATGLKAAGTNPSIIDVAGIARQAQLAAFTAAGGAGAREKTDTEWLKELSGDLKKIAADRRSLKDTLQDWWDNQVVGGAGVLGRAIRLFDTIATLVGKAAQVIISKFT